MSKSSKRRRGRTAEERRQHDEAKQEALKALNLDKDDDELLDIRQDQIAEGRRLEVQRELRLKSDVQYILNQPEGRRVLRHLLNKFPIYQDLYNGDTEAMLVAEGMRRCGLRIKALIDWADKQAFLKMEMEAASDPLAPKSP